MRPSIGRIVHYRAGPTKGCQAAVITKVHEQPDGYDAGLVDLTVFRHHNDQANDGLGDEIVARQTSVMLDAEHHNWHWPERESEQAAA